MTVLPKFEKVWLKDAYIIANSLNPNSKIAVDNHIHVLQSQYTWMFI